MLAVGKFSVPNPPGSLHVKRLKDLLFGIDDMTNRVLPLVFGIIDLCSSRQCCAGGQVLPRSDDSLHQTWLWKISKPLRPNLTRKHLHIFRPKTCCTAAEQRKKTSALQEHKLAFALGAKSFERWLNTYTSIMSRVEHRPRDQQTLDLVSHICASLQMRTTRTVITLSLRSYYGFPHFSISLGTPFSWNRLLGATRRGFSILEAPSSLRLIDYPPP
jgi:hypothetical protein